MSESLTTSAGQCVLRLSREVYSAEAMATAAHRFTGIAHVMIRTSSDGREWEISLRTTEPLTRIDALAGQFANEALDQNLREVLARKTEAIRGVIIAQAFSRTNLTQPELDSADPSIDPLRLGHPDPETGRQH